MTASLTSSSRRPTEPVSQDHRALERAGLRPLAPVPIPRSPVHLVAPEGQLHVHTAPYRGSFSNVFSQAMRAAGLGSRVLIAQFLKGGVQRGGSEVLCVSHEGWQYRVAYGGVGTDDNMPILPCFALEDVGLS